MKHDSIYHLAAAGIKIEDAVALRRISMTLHRWHELECGDGNNYGSWAIERDDESEKPYMVHHHYRHGQGQDSVSRTAIPDREMGARKRLGKIMAGYPGFAAYVQTDPRGCALYVLRPGDVPADAAIDSCYNRGIAVYK